MASTHTLTGNVYDLTGATLGATGVRVTVVTNLPAKSALIDKTTNSIHLGGKHADLDPSTGLFTIDLIDTSATDLNVAANTLQYEVRAEYVNPATRVRSTWTSGWFPFTAPANLADITTDIEPLAVESASGYALEAKGYRDEAATISGLTGEDAAVAFLVEDSGSATAGALSATIEAGITEQTPAIVARPAESTQRLMAKIAAGIEDVSILVVGDSTGNETTEWVYKLGQQLAADWPSHTVTYRLWNDGSTSYDAPTTITTGSGARTIAIYNASVAGFSSTSWQGPRAATAIFALTPDLVMVSLGHNEQVLTAVEWFGRYASLTESITARLTATDLVVIAQNPATADTNQQKRREAYRELAARRGYGFIDVCQAFIDTGNAPALTSDGIHPNAAGSTLWADTVAAAFVHDPSMSPRPQSSSSLLVPGINFLQNGDFADGETFWTLSGCTSAVDTVNFETARNADGTVSFTSTARKFTATGVGQATVSQYVPQNRARGRWVTVAARVYVPTGQVANVGRLAISDSTGSTLTIGETGAQGAFRWLVVARFVPATATNCRVLFYVDATSGGSGNCTIDRVVMVAGKLPQDMPVS